MGLAERKNKQKIHSDPRNLNWANDKEGLGFQMLQQMGWSEGKGLGAKGSGRVESVKILKKDNNLGKLIRLI